MEGFTLGLGILLFAIFFIAKGVKIVSQSDVLVIERLGKFNKELNGGINFIIPFIDTVRSQITVREQMVDIPKQFVITKDNVNISIDGIVFCKVDSGKDCTYNVVDFKSSISNLAMTTLRSEIGNMELDESLSNRDTLNSKLQTALGTVASNWGVTITRVEIADISVPKEIERAMQMQMEAEREKRAIQTKAEGEKAAKIREAEAFKQSEVLKAEAIERMAEALKIEQEKIAEGQKNAMETINEAMSKNEKAAEFLLAKDRVQAFKALAESGSNDKMILPYNVTEMVGSMSIIGDTLFKKTEGTN